MNSGIFYVKVRDNFEQDLQNFFPYINQQYTEISRNFLKNKLYPVLSVKDVTIFDDDENSIDSARFLVPTENNNFIWVHAEIFVFAGLTN